MPHCLSPRAPQGLEALLAGDAAASPAVDAGGGGRERGGEDGGVAAEPSHGAVESEPPLGQGGLGGGSGGLRSLSASWRRQVGQKVETQSSQSTGSEQCCDLDVVLAALCRRGPPYSIHADHLQSEPRFFAPTCPKRPARCHACCTFCLSRLIFSDDEMRSVHNTRSSTCRNKETAVHADSHL